MAKFALLLLCVLLIIQVKSTVVKTPRDLIDQVEAELAELKNIVIGAIAAAHIDLSNKESEFLANSGTVLATGATLIEQERLTVDQQVTSVKELANSAGVDISACLVIRETILELLPQEYNDLMRSCVTNENKQEALLVTNAKYIIDVTINTVNNLEFQVKQCEENLLCISPLFTEIELDKIRLPESINTEVAAVDSLLTSLRLLVQECSDTKVAQYVGDALALVNEIIICADGIIG